MRYFSDAVVKKINMSDHAKGKFLWHIQWLTATAFLATKSLQWFQMLKSPFQIDAIFFWQFWAKKIEDTHILANLGIILFYFIFDRSLVEKINLKTTESRHHNKHLAHRIQKPIPKLWMRIVWPIRTIFTTLVQ